MGIGVLAICLAVATLESRRAAVGCRFLLFFFIDIFFLIVFFLIVTVKNDGSCKVACL